MFEDVYDQIETPCVVVDRHIMLSNLRNMQNEADRYGVALRPHIKTHKIPEYAKLQLEIGAKGITASKVSEAEVMADMGIGDIFIAYPQIGPKRIERVVRLASRIPRLIVGVDSLEGAKALSDCASSFGITVEIRLEIDTGIHRTGILLEDLVLFAKEITSLPHLRMTGIYTFKSLVFDGKPTNDSAIASKEEGELMEVAASALRKAGISVMEISAGSTPTGVGVAATGKVTEIRSGTYIYNDYMLVKEGWAHLDQIAVRILTRVVSRSHDGRYVVIDGGTKTFPMDTPYGIAPYFYPGYAIVEKNEDLVLHRMYEEHGILESKSGKMIDLHVGDVVSMIPIHVCTAVNLQNSIYEYDGGKLREIEVAARGMVK